MHDDAVIGDATSVWHLAQERERAVLGRACVLGRGAYIEDLGVLIPAGRSSYA